jgi:hypothetical protein
MAYAKLVWFCKSLMLERPILGVQFFHKFLGLLVKFDGSLVYSIFSVIICTCESISKKNWLPLSITIWDK